MTDKKQKPVCPECGSDNIRVITLGNWDIETQQWHDDEESDGFDCFDCDEQSDEPDWIPIKPPQLPRVRQPRLPG